jgi:hypothetical protein
MEIKKKWVLIACGVSIISFGAGLLVGRQFPAHHYIRFAESRYLLDTSTGKVCDPLKNPNLIDEALEPNPHPAPACDGK